ncbi:hypothetical protein MMC25_000791 [Agyrium rufum]|nr:hypothetical protein [Agyrium rufum]
MSSPPVSQQTVPTLLPQPILHPIQTYEPLPLLPPVTAPVSMPAPRRTLTDQDRRRMCQYHQENPSVKQTEIGAMFGVERSTVSKVLRQKEKYLFPEEASKSPVRKSKGKFPDIERALANWAKNHVRQGLPLNDEIIRDKARFFAHTVGGTDAPIKVNSSTWLEKFKQKNHLLGSKPSKVDPNDSDSSNPRQKKSASNIQTPNGVSPISPLGAESNSPTSPAKSRKGRKNGSPEDYINFSYKQENAQSTTSITSGFSDSTGPSAFSAAPVSPGSPFYSPDPGASHSPFLPTQHSSLAYVKAYVSNTGSEPRSRGRSFPMIGTEGALLTTIEGDAMAQKYIQQLLDSPAVETPTEDYSEHSTGLTGAGNKHMQLDTSFVGVSYQRPLTGSMAPPPMPVTGQSSPNGSKVPSPIAPPPSQDEARQALELVMSFVHRQPPGAFNPQEYETMLKLLEKLKVQGGLAELPGGMHAISGKEPGRKRSIHTL